MVEIKIKPILFTGKKYSDNKSPIFIRLTLDRKSTYISVGHSIKPENWDNDESKVYEKKPKITPQLELKVSKDELARLTKIYDKAEVLKNAIKINSDIKSKQSQIETKLNELNILKKPISLKILKDAIDSNGKTNHYSFIVYAEKIAQEFLSEGKISTYKSCNSVIKKLKEWRKNKDLLFDEIEEDLLKKFELHLLNDLGNHKNTINKNFKIIRLILYKAIKSKKGYYEQAKNPFFTYKLAKGKTKLKKGLTSEELDKIIDLNLNGNKALIDTRNYFLFCFYNAGIRIGDLMQLMWKDIKNGRLEYTMDKQGGEKDIKLRPESLAILKQYKPEEETPSGFIFPILNNTINLRDKLKLINQIGSKTAIINKNLKKIEELAELNTHLTTHISRHTFGNIAKQKKANVIDISKALGHSSITITESYLRNFDRDSQDKTLDKIYGKAKGKK